MVLVAIIAMMGIIIFFGGYVLNYFAKEHNAHYAVMDDIADENERLRRINEEQRLYIKQLERSNIMLYKQIRSMTETVEEKE